MRIAGYRRRESPDRAGPTATPDAAVHAPCLLARASGIPAGFTLIELLFVLLVLAVLIGLGKPLIDVNRYRMQGAAHRIGSSLLAAQRLAVKRQHHVILAFDVAQARVRLHEDTNSDTEIGAGESVRWIELGEGVLFGRGTAPARSMGAGPVAFTFTQDDLPAVIFHRNGSAGEYGGFYLTSGRAAHGGDFPEDTRAIEVERSTGRTTWFRYTTSGWERGF